MENIKIDGESRFSREGSCNENPGVEVNEREMRESEKVRVEAGPDG